MARVFISYKRADKEVVFPLKDRIEASIEEECWIDMDGIESDAQFVDVIIRAIDEAVIVLFMYSKHHLQISNHKTDWTVRELSYAQQTGKRIVFINLDQTPLTNWLTFMFPQHQMVDVDSSEAMERLQSDLLVWLDKKGKSAPDGNLPYTEGFEYSYNDKTLEATITDMGEAMDEENINIPPVVQHNGKEYKVTDVGSMVFEGKETIKSVRIPHSMTRIKASMFYECKNLNFVSIPDSVTTIEKYAFYRCPNLSSVSIPDSVTAIEKHAFEDCSGLQYLTIPNSVVSIGRSAFAGCRSLKSINLPNQLNRIERGTFYECVSLKSITIPSTVNYIGADAFNSCVNLTSIIIPEGITKIRRFTFNDCKKLNNVSIPSSVRRIQSMAFTGCNALKRVVVPQSASLSRFLFFLNMAFDPQCVIIRK